MNRAIIFKTIRDHRLVFGLVYVTAVVFPILVILAMTSAPSDLVTQWLRMPLVRNMFRMLLGSDIMDMLNRTGFGAFAFVHPLMLTLVWSWLIVITTAALAGEVDRGTADLLLSLPVSRWGIYASISAVVFASGALLAVAPWLGAWGSEWVKTWDEPIMLRPLGLAVVNNLAAIWAVAGVAMAVSACTSRRGLAVAILFAWLLLSFLLNFLGALWELAERVAFLSLLEYFLPLVIVRKGALNYGHLAILAAIAVTGWTFGAIVFARRDIRRT